MNKIILLITIIIFEFSFAATEDIFNMNTMKAICAEAINTNSDAPTDAGPYFSLDGNRPFALYRSVKTGSKVWVLFELKPSQDIKTRIMNFTEPAYAVRVYKNKIFILFHQDIKVFDSVSFKQVETYKTHPYSYSVSDDYRAYDMTVHNEKIYVAHGGIGLNIIDANTGRFLFIQDLDLTLQWGHESKIVSLGITDQFSIVGVNPLTPPSGNTTAFNGLVRFNINDFSNPIRGAYHSTQKNISPVNKMTIVGDSIYLSNHGHLESIKEMQIRFKGQIFPAKKKLSADYKNIAKSAEIYGQFFVDSKKVYGCGRVYTGDLLGEPKYSSVVVK